MGKYGYNSGLNKSILKDINKIIFVPTLSTLINLGGGNSRLLEAFSPSFSYANKNRNPVSEWTMRFSSYYAAAAAALTPYDEQ